jgi:hypothetical protein
MLTPSAIAVTLNAAQREVARTDAFKKELRAFIRSPQNIGLIIILRLLAAVLNVSEKSSQSTMKLVCRTTFTQFKKVAVYIQNAKIRI